MQAAVEAIVYVADEPVTIKQISTALGGVSHESVREALRILVERYRAENHGIEVREIAGGYKMFTKPEHHETVRRFVKEITPPLKLSMAALETLATVAYRQPITLPEIHQIRGVDATAAVKTLLDQEAGEGGRTQERDWTSDPLPNDPGVFDAVRAESP